MVKRCYVPHRFNASSLLVIQRANQLLALYAQMGITVTLRTLYYRFVANNWLKNKQQSYDRLGDILGNARLAGLVDWDSFEDKTRNLSLLQHYNGPQDALTKLASWYHVDMWANQAWRPEVWVEKDAVVGNIEQVCKENDVPFFSCRGYTSLTEMYYGSLRLRHWAENGQKPYIIHFGDHDPSGIDMSRDIYERLHRTFMADCQFKRVALNMDQIEEYQPPPNFAKVTDSRYQAYVSLYGEDSWEVDALDPLKFREIVEAELNELRDEKQWSTDEREKARVKKTLTELAQNWGKAKRPQTVEEALKECRSWQLTDEQVRELNGELEPLKPTKKKPTKKRKKK